MAVVKTGHMCRLAGQICDKYHTLRHELAYDNIGGQAIKSNTSKSLLDFIHDLNRSA